MNMTADRQQIVDELDREEIERMFSQQLPGKPKYQPDAEVIASEYEAMGVSFTKGRKYP